MMDKKYVIVLTQVIAISFSINIITSFPANLLVGGILLIPTLIAIIISTKAIEYIEDKQTDLLKLNKSHKEYENQKRIIINRYSSFNKKFDTAWILVAISIAVFTGNSVRKNIIEKGRQQIDVFELYSTDILSAQKGQYKDFLTLRDSLLISKDLLIKQLEAENTILRNNIDSLQTK